MVCVVIPIYRSSLTAEEKISFIQYGKVLGHYTTYVACPDDLVLPKELRKMHNVKIMRFDKHYFEDIAGYNKLLLSEKFYRRFTSHQFMLIYQLDAYVFRDELMDWCGKGYDYIGAPWFNDFGEGTSKDELWKVGNGGFSLRKISAHIKTIQNQTKLQIIIDIVSDLLHLKLNVKKYFKGLSLQSSGERFLSQYKGNEDGFWCLRSQEYNDQFKVAPLDQAVLFAFENSPNSLFKINDNKLPFGCHAWEKYLSFWKDYIK